MRVPSRFLSQRGATWTIAAAIALGLGGAVFLAADSLVTTIYFWDDPFYYFQIARNVAAGHGFTFDGIHETNGFQPLWLGVLVPVFALVPGDVLPLRVVAVIEISLIVVAALGVFRVLRPRVGEAPALAAALLLVAQPGSTRVFRVGMESSLLLCLLVIVWQRFLATGGPQRRPVGQWLGLGAWSALAFLARLEAIVILPVILFLSRRRLSSEPRSAAALLAPGAVCAAAYLAWNRLAFDTWLPISGMVKVHWAWVGSPWEQPGWKQALALLRVPWAGTKLTEHLFPSPFHPAALAVDALLIGLVVAAGWRGRDYVGRAVHVSGAAFVLLAAGLMTLADKVLVRQFVPEWYAVPIFLATSVLGGALLHERPRLARAAACVLFLACLARGPLLAWHARDPGRSGGYYALQAARWLEREAPLSARIGTWYWGGVLGYFSHRHVTLLDGLANDAAYFRDVIQGGELEGYLRNEGLRWLAAPACGPAPSFAGAVMPLPGPLRARLGQEFTLATSFHGADHGCPGYAVWWAPP